jgi:pantothenate kinase
MSNPPTPTLPGPPPPKGNYLFLDEEPWRQLRGLFDETMFVDCPLDVAMARVFERQVRAAAAVFDRG